MAKKWVLQHGAERTSAQPKGPQKGGLLSGRRSRRRGDRDRKRLQRGVFVRINPSFLLSSKDVSAICHSSATGGGGRRILRRRRDFRQQWRKRRRRRRRKRRALFFGITIHARVRDFCLRHSDLTEKILSCLSNIVGAGVVMRRNEKEEC